MRRAGEEEILAGFIVATVDGETSQSLWTAILGNGREEIPFHPVTHPLDPPRPVCAPVRYMRRRGMDPATATQIGEIERAVAWSVLHIERGTVRQ